MLFLSLIRPRTAQLLTSKCSEMFFQLSSPLFPLHPPPTDPSDTRRPVKDREGEEMEVSEPESSLASEKCAKDEKHSIISAIFILSHFQTLENLFF